MEHSVPQKQWRQERIPKYTAVKQELDVMLGTSNESVLNVKAVK